jgi:hypothetical protein
LRSNQETDEGEKMRCAGKISLTYPIQGLLRLHSRYGPPDCSTA